MTPTQQRIMIFLSAMQPVKAAEIREALQISNPTFSAASRDLMDQEFITSENCSGHVVRYSLTEDGMSVANRLIRYKATDCQIVQPSRINKLEGKYEPTTSYQRNNGLKEIGRGGDAMLKEHYGTRGTLRVKKYAESYETESEQIMRQLESITRWAIAALVVILVVGVVLWGTM
jgi:DNA-binding MarR family transcriptional regulator